MGDQQLEQLRDSLYELAGAALFGSKGPGDTTTLADVPESDRADIEERAAIAQFEGNLTRKQADRLALDAYLRSKSRH